MRDTHTHYVPWFTRPNADGQEETVCGLYVTADQVAPAETRPTCWGCAAWLDNVDVIDPIPENQTSRAASIVVEAV